MILLMLDQSEKKRVATICTVFCYSEAGHSFGINYIMLKQNSPLLVEFSL